MIKIFSAAVLLCGLAVSAPSFGASDPGLLVPSPIYQKANGSGAGAMISARIKLGSDRVVRSVDRAVFRIAAGPVFSHRDVRAPDGFRRSLAPLAGFTLNPGFGAQATLLGQPVIRYQTRLGIAELARAGAKIDPKQKQGMSTLGVVGIVAGVAAVGYLGLVAFICRDGCSD